MSRQTGALARIGEPSPLVRRAILGIVGAIFIIPVIGMIEFTFRAGLSGGYTTDHWTALFAPDSARNYRNLFTGIGNSLMLSVVTVAIVLVLVLPTMILVQLRFPRLRRVLEFLCITPITVPAIVLVVGLAPVYSVVVKVLGGSVWTLAFAYGITVLPYAYRAIQSNLDAVDLTTLSEAARSLGAGWGRALWRVLLPNLRRGVLAASFISVAVVLGEYTIASLLTRVNLQTAVLQVSQSDPYIAVALALDGARSCFSSSSRDRPGGIPAPQPEHTMTITLTPQHVRSSATSDGAAVELIDVTKNFGAHRALAGLSLSIARGEFVALLGPSGCGKTTALRVLAGLEQVDRGGIHIDGQDVSAVPVHRRDLGMVFQSYSLFPHLSALDNIEFGLRMRKVPAAERRRRALEALEQVNLHQFGDRYAHQLSGGQQQRVALARALVTRPRVLLLDEPLSALDAKVRVQLRDEIKRIQTRLGITTVLVTDDQEEALAVADRVAVMREGSIEQIGTPEQLYLEPASAFVADFVGLSNRMPGCWPMAQSRCKGSAFQSLATGQWMARFSRWFDRRMSSSPTTVSRPRWCHPVFPRRQRD